MNCYAIACEYFALYAACCGLLVGVLLADGLHRLANERRRDYGKRDDIGGSA